MISIADNAVFARLSDDKTTVTEYPVSVSNIRNRAHPFDWYAKVSFDTTPIIPAFHTCKEILRVMGEIVVVSYELVPDTLNQLLAAVYQLKDSQTPQGQLPPPVVFTDLDNATIERIKELSKEHVQALMDAFAAIKEYDNIGSACSYAYSNNAAFKADADKCIAIRDTTWVNLYIYFDRIASGEAAVPRNSDEIVAILPAMSW